MLTNASSPGGGSSEQGLGDLAEKIVPQPRYIKPSKQMRDVFHRLITLTSAGGGCASLIHWANMAVFKYDIMEILSEIWVRREGPAMGSVRPDGVSR